MDLLLMHRLTIVTSYISIIGFSIALIFLSSSILTGQVVKGDEGTVYGGGILIISFLVITIALLVYQHYLKKRNEI